jgi:hypothetical protein
MSTMVAATGKSRGSGRRYQQGRKGHNRQSFSHNHDLLWQ